MKRFLLSIMLLCFVLSITAFAAELQYTALYVGSNKAFVNDIQKQIDADNPDVAVFVENDRSYVPVRFISESYNGTVDWKEESQTVNIKFTDRTISLTIGNPEITINGETTKLDVAPMVRNIAAASLLTLLPTLLSQVVFSATIVALGFCAYISRALSNLYLYIRAAKSR